MALVRKYSSGNEISPISLEWENVGKYNANQLASVLTRNLDQYISSQNFDADQSAQFRQIAEKGINSIKQGNVKRHVDGGYSGLFDEQDINNQQASNFVDYLSNMLVLSGKTSSQSNENSKPKEEWTLKSELGKIALGGEWDNDLWNKLSRDSKLGYLSRALQNRQTQVNQSDDIKLSIDKSDWLNTSQALIDQLNNKLYDTSDLERSIKLGYGDLNAFLSDQNADQEQNEETELERRSKEAAERIEQRKKDREMQATIDTDAWQEHYLSALENPNNIQDQYVILPQNSGYSDNVTYDLLSNLYNQNGQKVQSTYDIVDILLRPFNFQNSDTYNGTNFSYLAVTPEGETQSTKHLIDKFQTMSNALDFLYKNVPQAFKKLSNGFSAIYDTYNPETGTIDLFNPQTREYRRAYAYNVPELEQFLHEQFMKTKKVGGILKAQQGIQYPTFQQLDYQRNQELKQKEQEKIKSDEQKYKERAKKEGKTIEQLKKDDRVVGTPPFSEQEWTTEDYARMTAIGLDIASIISSFVPGYGSLVSAGTGFASTLTNLGADIAGNLAGRGSGWDTAKNALWGLGADILGVIPGLGAAGKISKVAKSFKYIAPAALTVWGATENGKPAYQSAQKLLSNPDSMTVQDWQNIANGLSLLAGASTARSTLARRNELRRKVGGKKMVDIETKKGKVSLEKEKYKKIEKERGLEKQNEILHQYYPDEELMSPFRWMINPKRYVDAPPKTWFYDSGIPKSHTEYPSVNRPGEFATISPYSWESIFSKMAYVGFRNKNSSKLPRGYKENAPEVELPTIHLEEPDISISTNSNVGNNPTNTRNNPTNRSSNKKGKKGKKRKRVTKKYTGGILKGEDGLITGVGLNPGSSWYSDNYLMYQNDLANQLLSGKITVDDINNMQRLHSGLYNQWTTRGDSYKDAAVSDYQNKIISLYPYVNTKGISNTFDRGRFKISPKAYTGDNPSKGYVADGRYSSITDWRTLLGRQGMLSDEQLKEAINFWKSKGYDYYLDPTINYYMLRKMSQSGNPQPSNTETPSSSTQRTPYRSDLRAYGNLQTGQSESDKTKWQILPEDVLALGRMTSGLWTNKTAADKVKSAMVPTLIDAPRNYINVHGDLNTRNAYYRTADELGNSLRSNYSSDPLVNAQVNFGITKQMGQMRNQGDLVYAKKFYETLAQSQANRIKENAEHIQVANQNRASINKTNLAKAQLDANLLTHQWNSVINPYLSGIENNWRQNRAITNQINQQRNANAIYNSYSSALQSAYNNYESETDPTLKQFKYNYYLKLRNQMQEQMYDNTEQWSTNPWMLRILKPQAEVNIPTYTGSVDVVPFSKSGSKITTKQKLLLQKARDFNKRLSDDNKLFHKILMEQKREYNKLYRQSSSFAAALIKDALSWK